MDTKQAFLAEKSLAVVGVSRTKGFANYAMQQLRAKGYRVFPVNANADQVEGEPCFHSVSALPEKVGAALVVVPPGQTASVVADCAKAGVQKVWMQQGAESDEAIAFCKANGIAEVHGACVMMHAQPKGMHAVHRFVWKLLGKL